VVGGLITVVAVVVVVSQEGGRQRFESAEPSAAPIAVPTTTMRTQ
jgi:hypothetical protein